MGFESQKIIPDNTTSPEKNADSALRVQPIWMSLDAVNRLTREGSSWDRLGLITKCAEVLRELPEGKSGIVVGSGDKSDLWRSRGWKTLDSDPESDADIITNANLKFADPSTQDYIFSECVSMGKDADTAVVPRLFLKQAFEALKDEGVLMMETASFDKNREVAIPNREDFTNMMVEAGCNVVLAVLGRIVGKENKHQKVFYYAVKTDSKNAQTEKVDFDLEGRPVIRK